jgi:hybrid polyketide synthase/nonribosomal peptide synthetase ACE1
VHEIGKFLLQSSAQDTEERIPALAKAWLRVCPWQKRSIQNMKLIVELLVHKFPHMRILSISHGDSAGNSDIIDIAEPTCDAFDIAVSSDQALMEAQAKIEQRSSKVSFHLLDTERSLNNQDNSDELYDLMIVVLGFQLDQDETTTLSKYKKLLRPGGFLLLHRIVHTDLIQLNMLLAPSMSYPIMSQRHPDAAFRKQLESIGFKETLSMERSGPLDPVEVSLLQVFDEQTSFLREPLHPASPCLGRKTLTIIGRGDLCEQILVLVKKHYDTVHHLSNLGDVVCADLPLQGTVLSVLGSQNVLDECSIFENITATTLVAIQKIFKYSKVVLWTTIGAGCDIPYNNLFRGFQRSAALETPDLRIQLLDFVKPEDYSSKIVAEKLLQIEATSKADERGQLATMLCYVEPEFQIHDGQIFVPRLKETPIRNARFNSSRRPITQNLAGNDIDVAIVARGPSLVLARDRSTVFEAESVRLLHSLLEPVEFHNGTSAFLSIGEISDTSTYVLVASTHLRPKMSKSGALVTIVELSEKSPSFLLSTQAYMVAQKIFTTLGKRKTLAVFGPSPILAVALQLLAAKQKIRLVLLTEQHVEQGVPMKLVHPHSTRRDIEQLLPSHTSMAFIWEASESLTKSLLQWPPRNCKMVKQSDLMGIDLVFDAEAPNVTEIHNAAENAYTILRTTGKIFKHEPVKTIKMEDFSKMSIQSFSVLKSMVLSWQCCDRIEIPLTLASQQVRFQENKTYWLVGLSNTLGRSLCGWMIERGARNIVLSSRSPEVPETWLDSMVSKGCRVEVFFK